MAPYMGNAQGAPALCSLDFPSLDLGEKRVGYRVGSGVLEGPRGWGQGQEDSHNGPRTLSPSGFSSTFDSLPVSGRRKRA